MANFEQISQECGNFSLRVLLLLLQQFETYDSGSRRLRYSGLCTPLLHWHWTHTSPALLFSYGSAQISQNHCSSIVSHSSSSPSYFISSLHSLSELSKRTFFAELIFFFFVGRFFWSLVSFLLLFSTTFLRFFCLTLQLFCLLIISFLYSGESVSMRVLPFRCFLLVFLGPHLGIGSNELGEM